MNKIIDFDQLFAKYLHAYFESNRNKYADLSRLENDVPKIYAQWCKEPQACLNNVSPAHYYDDIPTSNLIELLKESAKLTGGCSDILCDCIVNRKDAVNDLCGTLHHCANASLCIVIVNLLAQMQCQNYKMYAELLLQPQLDSSLKEILIEQLACYDGAKVVSQSLIAAAANMSVEEKLMIADIIVYDKENPKVYAILKEIFVNCEDIALAAAYFAKFGDVQALPLLQEAIQREDINYAEFIELRNAIEQLGGEVSVRRNFEGDPYYAALKQIK